MVASVPLLLLFFPPLALAAVYQDVKQLPTTIFDFVIIGGGTAGAVVANRLTENPAFDVLVIEAGPTNDGVLNSMVPTFASSLEKTIYDWNYTTLPGLGMNNRSIDYPRGRILGGSSSHNAMFYTRGSSDDYDRWARVTCDSGWSWKNVMPYILKSERWSPPSDHHNTQGEFDPSMHGLDGLLLTSLPGYPQPADDMVRLVSKQLPQEFPFLLDMNAGRPLGLGFYQGTIGNGTRSSSATAYLSATFTARPNLHILLNTKLIRLHTSSKKKMTFNSVELDDPSSPRLMARKELILAAGPINTPRILMNSGIGDREELKRIGIETILNLPSVGKNFTDQPFTSISYSVSSNDTLDNLHNNATLQAEALSQWMQNRTGPYVNGGSTYIGWSRLPSDSPVLKNFGDPSAGINTPHIELAPSTGTGLFVSPTPGGHFIGMGIIIVTPASRGSVTLNATDPLGKPLIDLGFYSSGFDLPAMREAIKLAERFYKAPIWNSYIIEQVAPISANLSDSEIDEYIRAMTFSSAHGIGTAAMSARNASYGVVNPDLLLKGASGLRIVDASVLPFINCGHTQAPVYAIAERASDLIKAAWK
ncbi:aryl-alcohol oxidase [Pholiota conissans]|uniref:pyranose dehydrogenase (acceptor) n=1 Tax=Pholiota conissans TaxID=109636 RepID=A0A9P6D3X8_9AGAR|nr:aryl-alcohol oxidase [Pholiota conissans]